MKRPTLAKIIISTSATAAGVALSFTLLGTGTPAAPVAPAGEDIPPSPTAVSYYGQMVPITHSKSRCLYTWQGEYGNPGTIVFDDYDRPMMCEPPYDTP